MMIVPRSTTNPANSSSGGGAVRAMNRPAQKHVEYRIVLFRDVLVRSRVISASF